LAVLGFPQEILGDSTKAGGIELLTNLATSVGINGTAFAAGNDTALALLHSAHMISIKIKLPLCCCTALTGPNQIQPNATQCNETKSN